MDVPAARTWALDDPGRLAALAETALVPGLGDPLFDPYTELVRRLLGVPVALVSFVGPDQQFFASSVGLDEPWATRGRTPLSMSFCKHVVADDAPLTVTDAVDDARVRDNEAVRSLGVRAYLGTPLRGPGGEPLGSLCAVDTTPRAWTDADLEVLRSIAEAADAAIALRVGERREAGRARAMSHELRTPITALRLELEQALADAADADRPGLRAALERVDDLSATVAELVDEARSRPAAGTGPVDLVALASAAVDAVRGRAGAAGRAIDLEAAEPATAVVDRVAVDKVLQVLLDNALRHGSGRVLVAVETVGGAVRLTVQDEGARGTDDIVDIARRSGGGDGATGLAVAADIAEALGGRLRSPAGPTTTVELLLPR